MATGLRLDFSSLGLDDYDRVCEELNFPGDWPDGLLAHAAIEVDGNLRVMDVWESRERFDQFVQERLQDAMREAVGDSAEAPEISQTELHAFYAR
jgi:hypothetical protein